MYWSESNHGSETDTNSGLRIAWSFRCGPNILYSMHNLKIIGMIACILVSSSIWEVEFQLMDLAESAQLSIHIISDKPLFTGGIFYART